MLTRFSNWPEALATEIARRLRGKHKPEFTPHVDVGDYVVVINAAAVRVTGSKLTDKTYWRHTGKWGDGCAPVGADDFQCQ